MYEKREDLFHKDDTSSWKTSVIHTQFLAGPIAETNVECNGDGPELCSYISLPFNLEQFIQYGCYASFVKPASGQELSEISFKNNVPLVMQTVRRIMKTKSKCITLSFLSDYLEYDPVIDQWLTFVRSANNGFASIDISPVLTFDFSSFFPEEALNEKYTLIIDSGVHSREWTAVETVLEFISRLSRVIIDAENGDETALGKLDAFECLRIVVVPVVDFYGFIKTTMVYHTAAGPVFTERLNRSQNYISADPNRSFPFCWGMNEGCNTYANEDSSGMFPLSFPCSRAMYGLMKKYKEDGAIFLDVHSYGNIIIPEPTPSPAFFSQQFGNPNSKKKSYQIDRQQRSRLSSSPEIVILSQKFRDSLLTYLPGYQEATTDILPYVACGTITQTAYHYFAYMSACIEVGFPEDEFELTTNNLKQAHNTAQALLELISQEQTIALCRSWLRYKHVSRQELPENLIFLN